MNKTFISIHALCEEGDFVPIPISGIEEEFLSTPSARRATREPQPRKYLQSYFYPRPLRGGRHDFADADETPEIFLSTPSARRATAATCLFPPTEYHFYPRPLRGGRRIIDEKRSGKTNFYPRPLRGGRLLCGDTVHRPNQFLSTPSARRAT